MGGPETVGTPRRLGNTPHKMSTPSALQPENVTYAAKTVSLQV